MTITYIIETDVHAGKYLFTELVPLEDQPTKKRRKETRSKPSGSHGDGDMVVATIQMLKKGHASITF